MNEPIINPWLIYWIDIATGLRTASIVLGVLSIMCGFATFIVFYIDNENYIWQSKTGRLFLYAGVIFCLLGIFVPNSNTMYKMLAVSYITPANIKTSGEFTDKAIDKILEKIANAIEKFERRDK